MSSDDGYPNPSLAFTWSKASGPSASISNGGSALASAHPSAPGDYLFALTVDDGMSMDTDSVSLRVVPAQPAAPSAPSVSTTGNYTVSWNPPAYGATHYELQEKLGSGSWSTRYSGTGLSHGVSGRGNGSYYYRVRACQGSVSATTCGSWSGSSAAVSVTLPPGLPGS